jgi:hypothetical protein
MVPVRQVSFSADARYLVGCLDDGSIMTWKVGTRIASRFSENIRQSQYASMEMLSSARHDKEVCDEEVLDLTTEGD